MIRPASLEASAKKVGLMVGSHEVRISWLDPKTDLVCFRRPTGQTCIAKVRIQTRVRSCAPRVCDHDLCRARPSAVHDGGCGHTPTPPPTHTQHGHAVPFVRTDSYAMWMTDESVFRDPTTNESARPTSHKREFEHARLSASATQRTRDSAHARLSAQATQRTSDFAHVRLSARATQRTRNSAHARLSARASQRTRDSAHARRSAQATSHTRDFARAT